jgi:ech hydrogenase subunit F
MSVMYFSRSALKNLGHKPATLMYPYRKRAFFERTRGHIDINIADCIYCGICQRRCPTGSIHVAKADKHWEIERMKCIKCNACVENCPKKCLVMKNDYTAPGVEKQTDEFSGA